MGDTLSLAVVLWLLYLSECFAWEGADTVLFTGRWFRGSRAYFPPSCLGNGSSGLVPLNLLPPFGRRFAGRLGPISMSPTHICDHIGEAPGVSLPPGRTGRVLRFADITGASADEAHLIINGGRFARCAAPAEAASLAETVTALAGMGEQARQDALAAYMDARFDFEGLAGTLASLKKSGGRLQAASIILFIYTLIVAPAVMVVLGENTIPLLGAGLFLLAVPVAILYYMLHRRFAPAGAWDRGTTLVKTLVCPPMGIRAYDSAASAAVTGYHPAAVAAAVMGEGEFAGYAAMTLRDLINPVDAGPDDPSAESTAQYHRENTLRAFGDMLGRKGLDIRAMTEPPEVADEGAVSYCPRCRAEYAAGAAVCSDCRGVRLAGLGGRR